MKLVQVYFNDQYIEVTSWNDGGVYIFNYVFQPIVLDKIIKNEDLGRAIKIALESSHNVVPELVKDILFSPLVKQKKQDRQNELMKKFNYRSKKSFFKNMRNISIELQDNYNISPITSRWTRL
nr:contact-dependent growth inhibition system immunity protein [Acinetobacter seifertii]